MKRSTMGPTGTLRRPSTARIAPWIGLAALALPAAAPAEGLGPTDRQVAEIVNRARPSVVSVRVGGTRQKRAALPTVGEAGQAPPFIDANTRVMILPAAFVGERGDGAEIAATREAPLQPMRPGDPNALYLSSRIGTGFCVDRSGTILTTADVVGDSHAVQVKLWDGRELKGRVLGTDPPTGVAIVKLTGVELPALRLATRDRSEPGQWAIIVGSPLHPDHRVGAEPLPAFTLARLGRPLSAPAGKLLQIEAPVGAGASGAPVLDAAGEVIGVVVATSAAQSPAIAAALDPEEVKARRDAARARREEEQARRKEERDQRLKTKGEKDNPEWQAQVERIAAEAQRLGERAAEHAKALSARIEERAKRLAAEAEAQSKGLRERAEADARRDAGDKAMSDADRQRLQADRARHLNEEMKPLMEGLQRKLDRDLKPLEEELRRQMEDDLKPLQDQLKKLNDLLPMAQGLREIKVDLAPEISRSISEAHEAARAALAEAMKASVPALPALPAKAPGVPPILVVPPSAPIPAAPEPSPAPGAQPAAFVSPAPAAAPAPVPAVAAPPEPPVVRFWAGRGPESGAFTYAIPAATVDWVASQIRESGHASHPFLGVRLEELKPAERERLKAPEEARVRVGTVWPDSPAKEAGLQPGDLILQWDGKRVDGTTDLAERLARARPGQRVSIEIWRDGHRQTVNVTPREMAFPQPFFRAPAFTMTPGKMLFRGPITVKPEPNFTWSGKLPGPNGPMPRVLRLFSSGQVRAVATGSGRESRITLDAQDAELESVLQELSRATGMQFGAEGEAARQHVTLKVERVSVDDLVESMNRLFHLRSDRHDDRITFRAR
jgi:S1-C subfamily serine protease